MRPRLAVREVVALAAGLGLLTCGGGSQAFATGRVLPSHAASVGANATRPGYSLLHQFAGVPDGIHPYGGVAVDGAGRVFGTTETGGTHGCGVLFELYPSDSGYLETVLRDFKSRIDGCAPSDNPIGDGEGGLFLTVTEGGTHERSGAVVRFSPSGGAFRESAVYSLGLPGNGVFPYAPLLKSGSNFFGTTSQGGTYGYGTIFRISRSLRSETVLNSFAAANGETPFAGLTADASGALYGTTYSGGAYGFGAVFKFVPQGDSGTETVLWSFDETDGAGPWGGVLVDRDGSIYGTTTGSSEGAGVVYRLTPNAGGYEETMLQYVTLTFGGLAEIGNELFGVTFDGGESSPDCDDSCGTIFEISKTGTGFAVLHSFTGADGGNPYAGLTADGKALYGTTAYGGNYADGVVFMLVP